MSSLNCSLLVHTFNGYKFLWEGYLEAFKKYWWRDDVKLYFGTNTIHHEKHNFEPFEVIYSGSGEWSDRLISLLNQIQTDYVLYMQEDHWLTKSPPDLTYLMELVTKYKLFRLQISPIIHFYRLFDRSEIAFFEENSKYLVSHQPSIWKKSFLLECLKPGETPWINEYKGTQRLQVTSQMRNYIYKKIAIYPFEMHKHMCEKGKFVENY